MRVLCAKDIGDSSGERRPFEGFIRSKPPKQDEEDSGQAPESAETAPAEQPFGFYRPDPEAVERDRVARRLWKQVFG